MCCTDREDNEQYGDKKNDDNDGIDSGNNIKEIQDRMGIAIIEGGKSISLCPGLFNLLQLIILI